MCGRAHGWRPAADLGAVHAPATTVVAGVVTATAAGDRDVFAIVIRMPNYVPSPVLIDRGEPLSYADFAATG